MRTSEINFQTALSVWWSFFWRAILWGVGLAVIVSVALGVIAGMLHMRVPYWVSFLVGVSTGLPISVIALRNALRKDHIGHRVQLVKQEFATSGVSVE